LAKRIHETRPPDGRVMRIGENESPRFAVERGQFAGTRGSVPNPK